LQLPAEEPTLRIVGDEELPILKRRLFLTLCALLFATPALAREIAGRVCGLLDCCPASGACATVEAVDEDGMQMPGAHHGSHGMGMGMDPPATFIEQILEHDTAGTSAEPASTPHEMLMKQEDAWMLMFHGGGFLVSQQQTGRRGGGKAFGASWLMPMAQRQVGPGTLSARVMLSLDPATITNRRYPELFQLGETAFGRPLVDGQHPHDFFMELALLYDVKLGERTLLSFYAAPVGDPAMGPEAYAHRVSASEDALAPLGHHLQDSTHIADDVITVGLTYKIARVEASAFHGREPDENRWNVDAGAINSWSARLTINPAANWSGQYSITRLKSPEQLFPDEDTLRMTASVTYNRPFARGNWASTLLWGRNRDIPSGQVLNGYLAESTVRFARHNYAWTRIENVDRTNELLLGENPLPPGFNERFLARVQAYSFGYDREFNFIPHVSSALGGQYTLYAAPSSLDSIYGAHPMGVLLFLRLRAIPLHPE
jgi:hypothetical protein